MFAIARNVAIDLARARSARPQQTGAEEAQHTQGAQGAQDTAEESLRAWEIEEALRLIGPHHRHAIVETYYRDRPCAEVAAEAGVPVGTTRSRLYYGLKALSWTGLIWGLKPVPQSIMEEAARADHALHRGRRRAR